MATAANGVVQRIFLSAADLSEGCRIASLLHPRTAHPISVALTTSGDLLEIHKFCEPPDEHPHSWMLVGGMERVQQDGSLYLATPLDPLFLLLPPLRALRGGAGQNRRDSSAGLFRPLSDVRNKTA